MPSLSYWSHRVDGDSDNTRQGQSEESGGWDHNNGPTTPNISTPNSNVSPQMFSHAGTSSHEVEMTHTPNLQHAMNEGSSPTNSSQSLDDTPLQGKRSLNEVYNATEAMSEQEVRELYAQEGELYLINDEPESYVEAMVDPNWKKAMDLELDSINKNKTWTLVDLPKDHKAIGLKWVFKLKKDAAGKVIKHKARVVAKGYVQQKGIDFDDAFAPVARLETIQLLLALAAKGNWLVHHLDVKSAFLNGELKEEVYVTQPSGFEVKGKEHMVYRLHKDSSHGTDKEDGRSTTGMAFYFSGNLITWSSQKQKTVALSSCEAEFMAATSAACQALWLRSLISDLTGKEAEKVLLMVDNESAIALMKNPVFHGRSKHIDTKYHFIRECVEREQIEVKHVSGDLQKADSLTKVLPRIQFTEMRDLMGVEDIKSEANTKGEGVG
ncbi:putative RNA-directed DNA polymerase [Helianthus annuus]|nr:putative RNA-directed DNA polymerase [Helianthus annuus]